MSAGFAALLFVFANSPVVASDGLVSFRQWETIGPSGGDVRAIEIDPRNKNHLFITTMDGQIYGSYDAGGTWELLANLHQPQLILDDLIVDARDSNVLYIAGHRHKRPGGFFKSVDGGRTWKEAKELKNESIHAMVQSSLDPDMLLIGTVTGVWISRDSGDTWSKFTSSTAPEKLDALAIDPRDTNTIYAGTWWRAYKTTDGGNSWRLVKDGMIDDSDVFAIDINPDNPDHIIASACSGIYQSFDQGEKWAKIQGIPSQSRRTRDIVQHPSRPGTVFAGTTEGFWMTTNGGKSWKMTTDKSLEINSIAVHPQEPNRVFIGTNNQGVMVSYDGGASFRPSNGNFSSRFTYNLVADVEKPNRLYAATINTAGGGGYIFVSDDFGRTWSPAVRNFDTGRTIPYGVVQDKENPQVVYLPTNFGIYKSVDRGASWTQLKAPKPVRTRRGRKQAAPKSVPGVVPALEEKINVLTYTMDDKNGYFAGTNSGLYVSYDVSKGWKKLKFPAGMSNQVFAVHVNPKLPQVIWVGTATSGVLMSNDSGESWTKMPEIPSTYPVSTITSDPGFPERLYVGMVHTIYISRDFGKTWTRRGGNLPLGNYNSIVINPLNSDEVYAASALEQDGGIFFSQDAGWTWTRIDSRSANLASHRVWSLTFSPSNPNQLLAGTHSSGIYQFERWDRGADRADNSALDDDGKPAATRDRRVTSNQ